MRACIERLFPGTVRGVAAVCLSLPLLAVGGPTTITVVGTTASIAADGIKLGELSVSPYSGGKTAGGDGIQAEIAANFTKTGIQSGGETWLASLAPLGMTYMQTAAFSFGSGEQQRLFRDANGNSLKGTFSDPPQLGYTTPDGRQLSNDRTPWYSNLWPVGTAGALPPQLFSGNNQFRDRPELGFADWGGFDGLLNLLIGTDKDGNPQGMNGALSFETALVGVVKMPTDDGDATNGDELLTGTYKINPLATFTWGFEFNYVDDTLDGITADDYQVAMKPLGFAAEASTAFWGAYDKQGDNAAVEWRVVPAPSSLLLLGMALTMLLVFNRRLQTPASLWRGGSRGR